MKYICSRHNCEKEAVDILWNKYSKLVMLRCLEHSKENEKQIREGRLIRTPFWVIKEVIKFNKKGEQT